MSISLTRSSKKLQLKIIASGTWDQDLAKIKSIPGARYNSNTKLWEVGSNQIADILGRMGKLGTH